MVAPNHFGAYSTLLQHTSCSKYTKRDHCPKSCMSFVLSPRACNSLKSAANCSSSNFIRANAPQYPHIAAAWVCVDRGLKAEQKAIGRDGGDRRSRRARLLPREIGCRTCRVACLHESNGVTIVHAARINRRAEKPEAHVLPRTRNVRNVECATYDNDKEDNRS